MKVLTVSRFFPAYHPRKGEETFFPEKILNALHPGGKSDTLNALPAEMKPIINYFFVLDGSDKKLHTIRAGNRWKQGEIVSLRVWSDKPYRSKQIEFAQVQLTKVIPIDIDFWPLSKHTWERKILVGATYLSNHKVLANNDGLSLPDFLNWFQKPMNGQILCWGDVKY